MTRLEIAPRAEAQIRRVGAWWRENRQAAPGPAGAASKILAVVDVTGADGNFLLHRRVQDSFEGDLPEAADFVGREIARAIETGRP